MKEDYNTQEKAYNSKTSDDSPPDNKNMESVDDK